VVLGPDLLGNHSDSLYAFDEAQNSNGTIEGRGSVFAGKGTGRLI
jgi:hypothetical protein